MKMQSSHLDPTPMAALPRTYALYAQAASARTPDAQQSNTKPTLIAPACSAAESRQSPSQLTAQEQRSVQAWREANNHIAKQRAPSTTIAAAGAGQSAPLLTPQELRAIQAWTEGNRHTGGKQSTPSAGAPGHLTAQELEAFQVWTDSGKQTDTNTKKSASPSIAAEARHSRAQITPLEHRAYQVWSEGKRHS
eukprot:Filipodium_phascolosomae@DN1489_c0_g1_i1.p1